MRVCPLCNSTTEASHCARDGTATIRVVTQAPPGLPRVGDVIAGRYRIEGPLGAGGFGAVYRVTHTGTGQACALKVLVLSGDQHQQSMRRFYAEARVTAGLQHVNTVRVFDFGQDDRGWYFLAMELLVGRTLAQWLSERRARLQVMSQGEAVHVAVSVLRSLTEAHGAGLVHRDLKPHNIFLQSIAGDEPTVKVLDFGIAKSAEFALTLNDQALGTPLYMSPEQCLSEPIDGRADLYSLACLLFQMVTGAPPFKGNSVAAIVLQQVSNPAPDVAALARTEVSPDFAAVIERALRKNPAERFASALEMREALRPCARPHRWELLPLAEQAAEGAGWVAETLEHGTTSDAGILGRPTAQPQVNKQLATAVQPHRAISAERSTPVAVDETVHDGQGLPASYTVAVEAPGAARVAPAAGSAGVTAGYAELPSAKAESPTATATPPAQAPTVATPTPKPGATREQLATTTDFSGSKTAGLPTAAMARPEGSPGEGAAAMAPSARENADAKPAAPPRSRGTTAVAAAATAVALALGMGWAMQRQSSGAPASAAPESPGSAGAEPIASPQTAAAAATAAPRVAGTEIAAPRPDLAALPSAATPSSAAALPAVVPAPAVPEAQPSVEQKQQAAAGRAAPRSRKAADKGAEPAAAPPTPAPAAAPVAPAQPAPAKEDRL